MRSPVLAFLAGLGSACAFAPLSLWPSMPLAFAVLLHLVGRAATLRGALTIGWAFGFGQFVLGLNWIATAFTYQAAMPAWLGWVAVALLSLYLAVFPTLAAGLAWRVGAAEVSEVSATSIGGAPAPSRPAKESPAPGESGFHKPARLTDLVRNVKRVLALAGGWIVTEWLRARLFTGFAWNPVGVSWLDTPVAQAAPWIGTYGLSALMVLAGGGLLALARREWRGAAVLLPVIAAALVPAPPAPPPKRARLHIVQPNVDQTLRNHPDYAYEGLIRLARLSRPAPAGAPPRLLLWPEAAVEYYLEEDAGARAAIAGLLRPQDMLLTGGSRIERDAAGEAIGARNSLFVLTPDARLTGRYDKAHLVPYGEYLPARPILSAIGLSRLVPGDLDFWSGPGPRTLDLPGFGRVGVQICYEVIFSGQVVGPGPRPDLLFNPSNDAWFGAWGPPQHLAQARLRAIEEGLPVVRSTPNGISAVIDPAGRLLDTIPRHRAGVIDRPLPRPLPPTPFARAGNLLPFALALLLGAGAIALGRRRR